MSKSLNDEIAKVFECFFVTISNKYGISKEKLKDRCFPPKLVKPLNKKDSLLLEEAKQFIVQEMPSMKMTIDKLKNICKNKGLKVSGKKEDLLNRIDHPDNPEHKSRGKKNIRFKGCDASKIIAKLQGPVSRLAIRKNDSGHYVHLETNLVFHPQTQKVSGKWVNGKVMTLTGEDIQVCKSLRVEYDLPENLDLGVVKVIDQTVQEVLGLDDFKDEDSEDEDSEDEDRDEDN